MLSDYCDKGEREGYNLRHLSEIIAVPLQEKN